MTSMDKDMTTDMTISLMQVIKVLQKKVWPIVIASVLGGLLAFLITLVLIPPRYESSVTFYVSGNPSDDRVSNYTSSDVLVSKSVADSYVVVPDTSGAVEGTESFEVVITGTNPQTAEILEDAVMEVLPESISDALGEAAVSITASADTSTEIRHPSYALNIITGFLMGAVLSVSCIILSMLFGAGPAAKEEWGRTKND